ncbi:MAG: flavin reductase family protein [Bacteroidetes bacterium]|nr:flavin reductase family protein [Bacteroidota bacterium]MDA0879294.1 flavin reductase family protein [Bacteroidota bacterium]MDA1114903.1 flavin reductase family protein [Bacteroidota bacterium]
MPSFLTKDLSTVQLQELLQNSIGPRPIAMASTIDADGHPNLSPFSFFNVFSANPPILVFSPARRVRDNTTKHSLDNVLEWPEVVINVVNYDMIHQVSLSSTEYPKGVNEFIKAGFDMVESDEVRPFRLKQSPAQFECKVVDVVSLGENGGAGNLVICEVLKTHISAHVLDENGRIDPYKMDLVARAGGNFYSRAKNGFFEIPKPISTMGIGVDALPKAVIESSIFSGNDLGKLANITNLPSTEKVKLFVEEQRQKGLDVLNMSQTQKQQQAKSFLDHEDVESAWYLLLS